MKKMPIINAQFFERDTRLWTTSMELARIFAKPHSEVLRAFRVAQCSQEFRSQNYAEGFYQDNRGNNHPMIETTVAGLTSLALGFTGDKATRFREAYIAEFQRNLEALHAAKIRLIDATAKIKQYQKTS